MIDTLNLFSQFHCIADHCPNDCCHGWAVEVDPKTYELYKSYTDNIGKEICTSLVSSDGHNYLNTDSHHCPHFTSKGLCDIVVGKGEEALPVICHQFPRSYTSYHGFVFRSLDLSCPHVVSLYLDENYELGYEIVNEQLESHSHTITLDEKGTMDQDILVSIITLRRLMLKAFTSDMLCKDIIDSLISEYSSLAGLKSLDDKSRIIKLEKINHNPFDQDFMDIIDCINNHNYVFKRLAVALLDFYIPYMLNGYSFHQIMELTITCLLLIADRYNNNLPLTISKLMRELFHNDDYTLLLVND